MPENLFGVALSGGGIRSASFCLGALQALAQAKLIDRMDYLSTVSGGGYVGASMVAAMTRDDKSSQSDQPVEFPFTSAGNANENAAGKIRGDVRDSEPVSHIRDHGKFLAPGGFRDILLSIAILLRGLAVNICLVLSIIVPLAFFFVATNPERSDLARSVFFDIAAWASWLDGDPIRAAAATGLTGIMGRALLDPFILSKTLLVALAVWLVWWATWRSYRESYPTYQYYKNHAEQTSKGTAFGKNLLIALAVVFVAELQPVLVGAFIRLQETGWAYIIPSKSLGLTASAIVAGVAFFRDRLAKWIETAWSSPTWGAQLRAIVARVAFYAAGLLLPLMIYILFLLIVAAGVRDPQGFLVLPPDWLVAMARSIYPSDWGNLPAWVSLQIRVPNPYSGYPRLPEWMQTPGNLMPWGILAACGLGILSRLQVRLWHISIESILALPATLAARPRWRILASVIVFAGAFGMAAIATRDGPGANILWQIFGGFGAISAVAILISWGFTENANGLHRLYRDRLSAAFRLVKGDGALPLHDLTKKGPYLLINAAINIRRSEPKAPPPASVGNKMETRDGTPLAAGATVERAKDPALRGRNADFFLFSRLFVGSDLTGYAPSGTFPTKEEPLDLATAVAISGAAVSSSMGRFGIGILGPTLALLNLRLGFWLKNPASAKPASRVSAAEAKDPWYETLRLYFFAEAFGLLRAKSPYVYVTDGGHIDNIGLYQLLRRRCKLIIVVDAEADPAMNFGAFCDAQRFARIDEGVRVTLEWKAVRAGVLARSKDRLEQVPKDDPRHRLHYAVGEITYEPPSAKDADETGPVDKGILLYVKASVTGDEADYVLDYERRNPAFPHESTGDLFFSEEQMEAYRALGYHATSRALDDGKLGTLNAERLAAVTRSSDDPVEALLDQLDMYRDKKQTSDQRAAMRRMPKVS